MNIEIANRLVELRKKSGLSQEDLADKLGLSRQAVSKWERAEASPDTDNLICLAKLYGVSLDDLLKTDADVDTIVDEQVKKEEEEVKEEKEESSKTEEEKNKTNVSFDKGIHIHSKDGSSVDIGTEGIHIVDDKDEVHIGKDGVHVNGVDYSSSDCINQTIEKKRKYNAIMGAISGACAVLITIAYILIGALYPTSQGWSVGWILFLLIPVIPSIFEAIYKKRFCKFLYPIFITAVYLFLGMAFGLWHPWWVLFITIPVYYIAFGPIDKAIRYHQIKNKNVIDLSIADDDKDDDKDEDDKDDD